MNVDVIILDSINSNDKDNTNFLAFMDLRTIEDPPTAPSEIQKVIAKDDDDDE